jgi:ABC-type antimicrobial peptide transport system permease subunit
MIGASIAKAMHKDVGDTIELGGLRSKIVGMYESSTSWEEMGGIVTLRDSQAIAGRPRKVMMYTVKLNDPHQAQAITERINREFPSVSAALTGDFVAQMPDMQTSDAMIGGISFIAILVGGIGVLNTMLMSVFERTREIGVLRALGWRRRRILGMILQEAVLLGVLGGLAGIAIAFGLSSLLRLVPTFGEALSPVWDVDIFGRAIGVALALGVLGGLYPALRATRLQPIEALRYE